MNQEIYNKLHTALALVTPLASERDSIIADMGETIWLESFEKMLGALPEDKRKEAIDALNAEDVNRAIEIFEEADINIEAILSEVAGDVMDAVMATTK